MDECKESNVTRHVLDNDIIKKCNTTKSEEQGKSFNNY